VVDSAFSELSDGYEPILSMTNPFDGAVDEGYNPFAEGYDDDPPPPPPAAPTPAPSSAETQNKKNATKIEGLESALTSTRQELAQAQDELAQVKQILTGAINETRSRLQGAFRTDKETGVWRRFGEKVNGKPEAAAIAAGLGVIRERVVHGKQKEKILKQQLAETRRDHEGLKQDHEKLQRELERIRNAPTLTMVKGPKTGSTNAP
jgi:hypothetical protein